MSPTSLRSRLASPSSFTLLAVAVALGTLAACKLPLDLEKERDEKKSGAKSAKSEKTEKAEKTAGSKKTEAKPSDDDGPIWTDTVLGETKPMARLELGEPDVKGLSILAPVGAKVEKPLGGTGVEISLPELGFLVWVHEDRTATFALMKQAAVAWSKDAKFVEEGTSSFIVSMKSFDDTPAYYYKGLYSFGSKVIVCETPTSIQPGEKAHAEQVGKACDSLQGPKGVALSGVAATGKETPSAAPGTGKGKGNEATLSPSALAAKKKAYADAQNAELSGMIGGKPAAKKK